MFLFKRLWSQWFNAENTEVISRVSNCEESGQEIGTVGTKGSTLRLIKNIEKLQIQFI